MINAIGQIKGSINYPRIYPTFQEALDAKVDKEAGKTLISEEEKTKLSGIETGAEVNQAAFSQIAVDDSVIEATEKQDTLALGRGSNITFDVDPETKRVTINAHIYNEATTSVSGLMSAEDKRKLNGIATGAEVNQNAFANIIISGQTTVAADEKMDTLTIVPGDHIRITPDAATDRITFAVDIDTMGQAEATAGTATDGKLISAKVLHDTVDGLGGVAGGFATLDANGKIMTGQLPTWVDDIEEAYIENGATPYSANWFSAIVPEAGKLYVLMEDSGEFKANSLFRWSGTRYILINSSIYTDAEKEKLAGIEAGAEVNQNAFGNVKVGTAIVRASDKDAMFEMIAGEHMVLSADNATKTVTISGGYDNATTSEAGLMSAADKNKLDTVEEYGEENQCTFSNIKIGAATIDASSKTDTVELIAGANIAITPNLMDKAVTITGTYANATTSAAGLMSANDKNKLDQLNIVTPVVDEGDMVIVDDGNGNVTLGFSTT